MENKPHSSLGADNWLLLSLTTLCVLLIACNIAMLKKYQQQQAENLLLKKKNQETKDRITQIGFKEVARWQAELAAWPDLELAIEALVKQDHLNALPAFNRCLERYPDLPLAYYLRGIAHTQAHDTVKAIEDFSCYLSQIPYSDYGLWRRAQVYLEQNQPELASQDLKAALAQNPGFEPAQKLLEQIDRK